ncbi:MAG: Eco57I restriction-modification methylase domain-containing protein [Thermoleophilia bacterium]|nr:Eco57I restriction-modification methylase domain-containing protein [Thermoleophilia bacterium]
MKVLDPGAGTGELLAAAARRQDGLELYGWDVDPAALEAASRLVPTADLEERSALDPWPGQSFDLVIGNPPYFQFRPTAAQKSRFSEVISGRANIFACFFKAGLDALEPDGRLAYIVPPSLNSGAYFEALREHIGGQASVEDLIVLDSTDLFEGANTAIQLLVLRKGGDPGPFLFERSCPESGFRRVIFSAEPEMFAAQFEGRRTLWELGYEAVTGTVVWNQRRADLRETDADGAVPLIWSHNLRQGEVMLGTRADKPQYVAGGEPDRGPAVLVNRVVGSVGRGELRTALIPDGMEFLAENHVNRIRMRAGGRPAVGWQELQKMLADESAAERIRLLTGNTQISATELTHLLPLG